LCCPLHNTRYNNSPAYAIEILRRVLKLFKDYCGLLNEETIRLNFALVYEILDDVFDYGYVQTTSADVLKHYVFNEPVQSVVQVKKNTKNKIKTIFGEVTRTTPSSSAQAPITMKGGKGKKGGKKKNEIFVDVFERIALSFNSSGFVLNSSIDGSIQMKSYLAGNPELVVAFNDDILVGKENARDAYGAVVLDDCVFNEVVRTEQFDSDKILTFQPPEGEFVLMNYRLTSAFTPPFRIFPFFELLSSFQMEVVIKIRAEIPEQNFAANVRIAVPVPQDTASVQTNLSQYATGQACEYDAKQKKVLWNIRKFAGGTEVALSFKITLKSSNAEQVQVRKQVGPVSMEFEIPMFNPSGLKIKYLRVMPHQGVTVNPYRWVRYVSEASSYVSRIG
jgi:AP-4 complex subunit mu-1